MDAQLIIVKNFQTDTAVEYHTLTGMQVEQMSVFVDELYNKVGVVWPLEFYENTLLHQALQKTLSVKYINHVIDSIIE